MDDIILSELEFKIPIFEVSRMRPAELKKIDSLFDQIRREKFGSRPRVKLLNELSKAISQFSGVKRIRISTKKNWFNACVIVTYNNLLPELFKTSNVKPEEASKYIRSFYVIIGEKMYDRFRPKELTAVLLHEIGHVYQHTSALTQVMPRMVNQISQATNWYSNWLTLFSMGTSAPVTIPLSIATFALSRSLTFAEHNHELDADDFAAKHGYADEIAKAFYKFNKHSKDHLKAKPKNWLERIYKFLRNITNLESHPDTPDRICNLINKMKTDYKKQYPKLSKEISTIYADIRC